MTIEVRFTQSGGGLSLGHGRFFHDDVGRDALGLDRAPVRREIARGGELDRGAIAEREDGLHRSLAERLRAHYDRALVILQRASHDFRC